MADTTLPGVLLDGDHASRPAANTVASGTKYACSTHTKIYTSDGSSWTDWFDASAAGSGIDDQGTFTYLDATEGAAPSTPASGFARIYAKADGRIYSKDDAGVEYGPFDADSGGSAGPLLYQDSIALHALGDEFSDALLTGWTLAGGLTTGDVTAVTTEVYDDTCLDIVFSAQGDRMTKAIPTPASGNFEISLVAHGYTNGASDPSTAIGQGMSLVLTNDAGTGVALCLYNSPSAVYLWTITGWSLGSATNIGGWSGAGAPAASSMPHVLKIRKVGTTITGYYSEATTKFMSGSITNATTFTRMGIAACWSTGGTNPRMRVGRFNVEEL